MGWTSRSIFAVDIYPNNGAATFSGSVKGSMKIPAEALGIWSACAHGDGVPKGKWRAHACAGDAHAYLPFYVHFDNSKP